MPNINSKNENIKFKCKVFLDTKTTIYKYNNDIIFDMCF